MVDNATIAAVACDYTMHQHKIPLQSIDSPSFDNFFGLPFKITLLDSLFQLQCLGWNAISFSSEKKLLGKTIATVTFTHSDCTVCDCKIAYLRLSFTFFEGEGYLLSRITLIVENTEENIHKLLLHIKHLSEKYTLYAKRGMLFHPESNREIMDESNEKYYFVTFREKGAKEVLHGAQDVAKGITPYNYYDVFYQSQFDLLLHSKLSETEQDFRLSIIIAVRCALSPQEEKEFIEFYRPFDKKKYLYPLGEKLSAVFHASRDIFDKDAVLKALHTVIVEEEKRITEEIAAEKEKKRRLREEKKQKKNNNPNNQNEKKLRVKRLPNFEDIKLDYVYQCCKKRTDDMEIVARLLEKWMDVFKRPIALQSVSESAEVTARVVADIYESGVSVPYAEYGLDSIYRTLDMAQHYVRTEICNVYTLNEESIMLYVGTYALSYSALHEKEPYSINVFQILYTKGENSLSWSFCPYADIGVRLELSFGSNKESALKSGIMLIQDAKQQTDTGMRIESVLGCAGLKKVFKCFSEFLQKLCFAEEKQREDAYNEYKEAILDGIDDL